MANVQHKIVERLSTKGAEVEDARFGNRFTIRVEGVHAFEKRPMTGYGSGGFVRAVTPELGSRANVAHNTYLSVLVEHGIVGWSLYLTMFVVVFRSLLRLPRLERRFALTLLATLSFAILSLTWDDRKPLWLILATLLGLSQGWVSAAGEVVRPPGSPVTGRALGPRPAAPLDPRTTPTTDEVSLA